MYTRTIRRWLASVTLPLLGILFAAEAAYAHCDGLDGPVVEAGRAALATGDVDHALVWVFAEDEAEIRSAFSHAMGVRKLGGEAARLADHYFFETLVRVHRAGEGEPYTGLKPAGRDLGPVIPAADHALEHGSIAELEALVVEAVRHGLRERFHAAAAEREFDPTDVAAGRDYVAAYVPFLHYAEALYALAAGEAEGHGAPAGGSAAHSAH